MAAQFMRDIRFATAGIPSTNCPDGPFISHYYDWDILRRPQARGVLASVTTMSPMMELIV
jgi:hypothetical protein